MSRKLKFVQTHSSIFVEHCGQLKTTLSISGSGALIGAEMLYTSDGVEVKYKGQHFVIPLANVVAAVFAPEETAPAKAK